MRILVCHRPGGAFGYISDGWVNCLRERGHHVQRWDGELSSWLEFDPNLYIGCSGHKQSIPVQRHCKIAIHVNPYGLIKIDGINESQVNIKWVLEQRPDVVFGYGQESDRLLWDHWQARHGIMWVPMPTAGDRTIFKHVPTITKTHEMVYLGGRWAYKGLSIDEYLVPLLRDKSISSKLFGWGDWPAGLCSGLLRDDQANYFLNSGIVGPCISERHTHSHGIDIPERAFKVALCGTLIIHDPVLSLRNMIPSAIVANSAAQFHEYCRYYCKHIDEAIVLAEKQRQEVLAAHTYHHRISKLLGALGFVAEAEHMVQ